MLQTRRVYDFQRIEPFYCWDGSEISESLNDLAKVDFSIGCIVSCQTHFIRTVFNDADDMFSDILFIAGCFCIIDISPWPQGTPTLLVFVLLRISLDAVSWSLCMEVDSRYGRSHALQNGFFGGRSWKGVVLQWSLQSFEVGVGTCSDFFWWSGLGRLLLFESKYRFSILFLLVFLITLILWSADLLLSGFICLFDVFEFQVRVVLNEVVWIYNWVAFRLLIDLVSSLLVRCVISRTLQVESHWLFCELWVIVFVFAWNSAII